MINSIGTGLLIAGVGEVSEATASLTLDEKVKEPYDEKGYKKMIELAKKRDTIGSPAEGDRPSYFSLTDNKVHINPNDKNDPSTIAHELGHLETLKDSPISSLRGKLYGNSQRLNSVSPLIAGGGVGAYKHLKDKKPEVAKKIRTATLLGTLGAATPMIIEEAIADHKGKNILKDLNLDSKENMAGMNKGLGFYGTRLIPGLVASGYFAADALKDKIKQSSVLAECLIKATSKG